MNRTSSITLSIADRFSQPLQQYVSGAEKAAQATDKLATAGKQGADAAAKLAKATEDAARAQKAAGDAAQAHAKQQMAALNEIQQAEKAAREQSEQRRKNFLEGLTAMRDGLVVVAGAVVAFGVAVNKAFEFGKAGGAVIQTTESFNRMMQVVGAMPGQLDRLREAARGTVDDLTLMANVQTLLAGTSGQLATSFANAAPQLLEIAKAANKVNPTLGDTNFMFESIARGIKRSSPLILDNLGIVVKLGPAYDAYAESIGKSVEALTAEEKQIALLNAVLKSGNTLIEQAGNNADSATDSFARAEAAWKNFMDSIKAGFAGPMGELATEFSEQIELVVLLQKAVDRGAMSSAEAQKIMVLTTFGLQDAAEWVTKLAEAEKQYQYRLNSLDPVVQNHRLAVQAAAGAQEEETAQVTKWLGIANARAQYLRALTGHTYEFITAEERLAEVEAQMKANETDYFVTRMERMTRHSGEWFEELDKLVDKLGDFKAANGAVIPPAENLNDLLLDAAIATDAYNVKVEKLAELQKKLSEETDPDKQRELERDVRLAERAVRDAASAMEESGTKAGEAAGGIANYESGIRNTTTAIHDMIAEAFTASLIEQLDALAELATKGHDTEAAFLATLDALRQFNPELARQFEISHGLSLVQDRLNAGLALGIIDGPKYKQIVEDFTTAIANGVPFADAMAAALAAINAETRALPPSGTTWEYYVHTYNTTHDVQVSEPGPPAAPIQQPESPFTTPKPGPNSQMAGGGHMTIPPGFFNDSYRIGVEQGEEVTVRTARQQREGTNIGSQTNMGGVTIQIIQQPWQSAREMAMEVKMILDTDANERQSLGV